MMNQESKTDLASLDAWITAANSNGAVAVLCGKNGDMDTIGSAIALAAAIPNGLACGLHQDKVAKRICAQLNAPFRFISQSSPNLPKKLGGIICVDAAAPSQIGIDLPASIPLCIIDHHTTSDWTLGENDLEINWPARATTQIIHQYLTEYSSSTLTDSVRRLLLAGLITDTGRFRHADKEAFVTAGNILTGSGIDYAEFIESVETESITDSERGAIAAGMARVKSIKAGDWHLMHTYVGTNEGRMCKVLQIAGAEIALVSRHRDGQTRMSARATRSATIRGVNLGHIMKSLAEKIGGEGGGHDGAAGWSGESDRIAAESAFIHALSGIGVEE